MSGAKKFLEFDLRIEIYHIRINECYIEKTTFYTRFGHYEYLKFHLDLYCTSHMYVTLERYVLSVSKSFHP